MQEISIIYLIAMILLTSLVINVIFKKLGITPIIGYILTGAVASQIFCLKSNHILDSAAEYGIVFLMFMIGLEFSLEKLKAMKKEVFGLGLAQIVVTTIIIYILLLLIGFFDTRTSFLIAITLSLSSTAIAIKILKDSGKIKRHHGRSSVGILLMQDIAVIPILVMVSTFANKNSEISGLLIITLLNSIGGLVTIYFFGKYVVNYFLRAIIDTKSNELFMMAVLFIVIAAACIAHFFQIPYSMGAFIAGIIISESAYKHQIEADLIHFKDLLIGIFFLSVGLLLDLGVILEYIHIILPATIVLMILKTTIVYTISRLLKYEPRTSIKTALLTSQVGEFAFIIFSFALNGNLITNTVSQILSAIAISTMFATPFIAKYMSQISFKLAISMDEEIIEKTKFLHHHAVVIGYGNTGKWVVKELEMLKIPYKAIDTQRDLVYDAQSNKKNVIFGNAVKKNFMEVLNIKEAGAVIITINKQEDLLNICKSIKTEYPNVNLVVKTLNTIDFEEIKSIGIKYAVDQSKEMGSFLVELAMNCDIYQENKI